MTTYGMDNDTRPIGWIRAARKVYETFPVAVRDRVNTALTITAESGKVGIASRRRSREGASGPILPARYSKETLDHLMVDVHLPIHSLQKNLSNSTGCHQQKTDDHFPDQRSSSFTIRKTRVDGSSWYSDELPFFASRKFLSAVAAALSVLCLIESKNRNPIFCSSKTHCAS